MFNWREIMKVNANYFEHSRDENLILSVRDNILNSSIESWEIEQLPGIYFVQLIKLLQTLYRCSINNINDSKQEVKYLTQQNKALRKGMASLENDNTRLKQYEDNINDNAYIIQAYEKCIKIQDSHYHRMKEKMMIKSQIGLKNQKARIGYSIDDLNDYFSTVIPLAKTGYYPCNTTRNERPDYSRYNISLKCPAKFNQTFNGNNSHREQQSMTQRSSPRKITESLRIPLSLFARKEENLIKEEDEYNDIEFESKVTKTQLTHAKMKENTKVLGYSGFNQQIKIPHKSFGYTSTSSLSQLRDIQSDNQSKAIDYNYYSNNSTIPTEPKEQQAILEQTNVSEFFIPSKPQKEKEPISLIKLEAEGFMKKFILRDDSLNDKVSDYLGQIYPFTFILTNAQIEYMIANEMDAKFKQNRGIDLRCKSINDFSDENSNNIISFINSVVEDIDMKLEPNIIFDYYYNKLCQCINLDRDINEVQSYFAIKSINQSKKRNMRLNEMNQYQYIEGIRLN